MVLRVALIGIDHPHGAGYRETLLNLPAFEIVAAYDLNPGEAWMQLPPSLRHLEVYGDIGELLAAEAPDVALVALSNDLAPAAIAAAAEAGVHVFAEKPCARSAAEFQPALAAVERAGVVFYVAYMRRISPVAEAIRQAVQAGLLGRLVSVEARWITTGVGGAEPVHRAAEHWLFDQTRSGGGILHWLGCHWLDTMHWVAGAEVVRLTAMMDTLGGSGIDVDDTAAVALRYDNGMLGTLHCSYVTDRATDQLFFGLRGTSGWVEWERDQDEVLIHSSDPRWVAAPTRHLRFEGPDEPGYCGSLGVAMWRHFAAALRGEVTPLFTARDALRVLGLLDAACMSATSSQLVSL